MRRGVMVMLAVLALALAGCSDDGASGTAAEQSSPAVSATGPVRPSTEVPWDDYAPSVKTDIDAMLDARDCAGLQEAFNAADANGEATMARTGHNNAALMAYIDEAMKLAGCY